MVAVVVRYCLSDDSPIRLGNDQQQRENCGLAISGLCSRLAKNYLHKPASRNRDSRPACLLLSLVTSLILSQFDLRVVSGQRGISALGECLNSRFGVSALANE